jgi:DNA-binding transcriptional MerR regulator
MLIRIGALSERTGVSAETLRSWERRYNLLRPERTAGGFRLYSEEDAGRIREMVALLQQGVSAGEAARLVSEGRSAATQPATPLEEVRRQLDGAARRYDEDALEAAIDLVLARFDLDAAIRDIFIPALRDLGDGWARGEVSVAQEHFTVNVLRGRLMGLARGWDQGFGPRALLACPPGEFHDVSLVMFGLALRRRGWRVTFLGANTPLDELFATQEALEPAQTVLYAADWGQQASLARTLRQHRPSVVLAGSTADAMGRETGCRTLLEDPVTEAARLTREAAASLERPPSRRPRRRKQP